MRVDGKGKGSKDFKNLPLEVREVVEGPREERFNGIKREETILFVYGSSGIARKSRASYVER